MIPKSCAESFEITIDQQNEEAVWFSSGSSKISEGIRTFLKKVSSGDKIYLTKLL
jgi:hypothetical protein